METNNVSATNQPSQSARASAAGSHGATRRMIGAEAIVQTLEDLGAEIAFGIPGGAVLPLYDAMYS